MEADLVLHRPAEVAPLVPNPGCPRHLTGDRDVVDVDILPVDDGPDVELPHEIGPNLRPLLHPQEAAGRPSHRRPAAQGPQSDPQLTDQTGPCHGPTGRRPPQEMSEVP